jgi:hypothetical protein
VELALDSHVALPGVRIPVVIVAGLVCYLTTLGLLGLAPEERRLFARARARLRTGSAKRAG